MGEWITEQLVGTVQGQAQTWLEANGFTLLLWLVGGVIAIFLLAKFGKWIAGAVVVLIIGAVLVTSSTASMTQAQATSAVAEAASRGGIRTGGVVGATVLSTLLCVAVGWGAWQYNKRQKAKGKAGTLALPGFGGVSVDQLLALLMTQMLQGQRNQVQAPPPTVVVVNGSVPQRQADTWDVERRQPAALEWGDDDEGGGFTWGE